jgi:hypothetical protein
VTYCRQTRGLNLARLPALLGHLKKRAIAQKREAARIALVALACEVVVLTSLMDQGLESVAAHLGADEIRLSGWIHRNAALDLLSQDMGWNVIQQGTVLALAASMRTHLRDIHYLRGRLDQMLRSSRRTPINSRSAQLQLSGQ